MTFEATLQFDDGEFNIVLSRIVKDAFLDYGSDFASDIAQQIDLDVIAERVAEDIDYSEICDVISDNIEQNHLDEIADYASGKVAEILAEEIDFEDLTNEQVKEILGDSFANRIDEMSNTINKQAIAISQLTKTVDSMQNKKFWKKLLKGK